MKNLISKRKLNEYKCQIYVTLMGEYDLLAAGSLQPFVGRMITIDSYPDTLKQEKAKQRKVVEMQGVPRGVGMLGDEFSPTSRFAEPSGAEPSGAEPSSAEQLGATKVPRDFLTRRNRTFGEDLYDIMMIAASEKLDALNKVNILSARIEEMVQSRSLNETIKGCRRVHSEFFQFRVRERNNAISEVGRELLDDECINFLISLGSTMMLVIEFYNEGVFTGINASNFNSITGSVAVRNNLGSRTGIYDCMLQVLSASQGVMYYAQGEDKVKVFSDKQKERIWNTYSGASLTSKLSKSKYSQDLVNRILFYGSKVFFKNLYNVAVFDPGEYIGSNRGEMLIAGDIFTANLIANLLAAVMMNRLQDNCEILKQRTLLFDRMSINMLVKVENSEMAMSLMEYHNVEEDVHCIQCMFTGMRKPEKVDWQTGENLEDSRAESGNFCKESEESAVSEMSELEERFCKLCQTRIAFPVVLNIKNLYTTLSNLKDSEELQAVLIALDVLGIENPMKSTTQEEIRDSVLRSQKVSNQKVYNPEGLAELIVDKVNSINSAVKNAEITVIRPIGWKYKLLHNNSRYLRQAFHIKSAQNSGRGQEHFSRDGSGEGYLEDDLARGWFEGEMHEIIEESQGSAGASIDVGGIGARGAGGNTDGEDYATRITPVCSYIRKLPEGYRASMDAKQKAEEYYVTLKDGYTFVEGFNKSSKIRIDRLMARSEQERSQAIKQEK